jgi:hypothetical protein
MTRPTIEAVQGRLTNEVMEEPGVLGTMIGECDSEPCIVVLVEDASDALRERIPTEREGYRIAIQVTGEIRALE